MRAFSEEVHTIGSYPRPLRFKTVVAIVYAFFGLAGALAIISKFIVTPLFEELTRERAEYAEAARSRLMRLNARLCSLVSSVPSVHNVKSNYVDSQTQTGHGWFKEAPKEKLDFTKFKAGLMEAHASGGADQYKSLIASVKNVEQELQTFQSGQLFTLALPYQMHNPLQELTPMDELRKEVREFKGALLSL